jgi:hypothetical protein
MMIFLLQRLDMGSDNTAAGERFIVSEKEHEHFPRSARFSRCEMMFKAGR